MKKISSILLIPFFLFCQKKNSPLIDSLLRSKPAIFSSILSSPKKYRIQIIYTQIDRDKNNKPVFTQHNYFLDSTNYFYCASMVKLPCSILALQKLHDLNISGLDKNSRMYTDSVIPCHKKVSRDFSSPDSFPSIAHYIRKMLLVSDNLAFGRTYEFLTPDYIHDEAAKRGYGSMRIVHRFDGGCAGKDNLLCNPITFRDQKGNIIFNQPQSIAAKEYNNPLGTVKVGRAHIAAGGKKINEPKDFTTYNFMHLQQVNDLLKWVVFLPYAPDKKRFNIDESDRKFLLKYLCLYPRESDYPKYDPKDYYDSYKKYLIYGDSREPITDTNIRIFNIVGQSYGFLADCAYIVDFKHNSEFMLSAVIYVNSDGVLNDGKYEYRSTGFPYLANLGRLFLEYEKKRKKKNPAVLGEFKLSSLAE